MGGGRGGAGIVFPLVESLLDLYSSLSVIHVAIALTSCLLPAELSKEEQNSATTAAEQEEKDTDKQQAEEGSTERTI